MEIVCVWGGGGSASSLSGYMLTVPLKFSLKINNIFLQ